MNVTTEFNTRDEVYFLLNNTITKGLITGISINVQLLPNDTDVVTTSYLIDGIQSRMMEISLFRTPQDLVDDLLPRPPA